jgi:pyruvate dehydrogenase E2 component (dihydrolipoamide acetyltransferase)
MGESFDEAKVVNWNVKVGQDFANGDILLEIETDKSIVEIPATEAGKLIEQLIAEGEMLQADTPVARIEVEGEAQAIERKHDNASAQQPAMEAAPVVASARTNTAAGEMAFVASTGGRPFATPIARRLADSHGVDLGQVQGTGPRNRITKIDVMSMLPAETGDGVAQGGASKPATAGGEPCRVATAYGELYVRRWQPSQDAALPTFVLLHGIFGDIDTWAATLASLSRNGRNIIAVDLPCHGRSTANVARFEEMVDAVCEAVAKLCHGRIAWVGHSLGAAVAVKAARRMLPQTASVTLFAPAGLGTEIDQSFLDGMRYARTKDALAREIGKLTATRATLSTGYLEELSVRLAERATPLAAICNDVSSHGVQQISIRADLEALSCPVTIVHGRSDGIIPWQHALNAPPNVALHLVPNIGHMPQAEAIVLSGAIIERVASRSAGT